MKYAVIADNGRHVIFCTRAGTVLLFDNRERARAYAVACALKLSDPTSIIFKPVKYINSAADL